MYDMFVWLIGKLFIKVFFNFFNFLVIDVGKVDEVSGYFFGRVVLMGFFVQMNVWQFQFFDVIGYVRVNLMCQIDKLYLWIGIDVCCQLIQWYIEGICQCFLVCIQGNFVGVMEFFWVGLDSFYWYVDCQWMFGVIGNYFVCGGYFLYVQRMYIVLVYQYIGVDYLQSGDVIQQKSQCQQNIVVQ